MGEEDGLRLGATLFIPPTELHWTFGPSGGPGGQHANRAHSRAEVRFSVVDSAVLSETQRNRLIERVGPEIRVVADDERSQFRNRRLALERLGRRLRAGLEPERPRRPTRPGRGAIERRLAAKRRQSSRKQQRRNRFGDGN